MKRRGELLFLAEKTDITVEQRSEGTEGTIWLFDGRASPEAAVCLGYSGNSKEFRLSVLSGECG